MNDTTGHSTEYIIERHEGELLGFVPCSIVHTSLEEAFDDLDQWLHTDAITLDHTGGRSELYTYRVSSRVVVRSAWTEHNPRRVAAIQARAAAVAACHPSTSPTSISIEALVANSERAAAQEEANADAYHANQELGR